MSDGLSRLLALKAECRDVAGEMALEANRYRALEGRAPVKAISSFNLFQTPEHIAERMARLLGPVIRCLEPSAGLGRLAKVAQCEDLVMVEQSADCCGELLKLELATTCRVLQRDFLTVTESEVGLFDGILMNPPFKMGTDARHYARALELLKPGGRIVGLCYNGAKQNAKLKPMAATWEVLPENSFKEEGTRASIVLLTFVK